MVEETTAATNLMTDEARRLGDAVAAFTVNGASAPVAVAPTPRAASSPRAPAPRPPATSGSLALAPSDDWSEF
ncbi:hypothetical protein ACI4BE_29400, partial [Klebsiella pneumoniae]